ncbi:MAG: ATP-binding protein [Acidobacteriota bacterium]
MACTLVQALLDQATAAVEALNDDEQGRRRVAARALLQESPTPTAVLDRAGEVEIVNDAWRVMFHLLSAGAPVALPVAIAAAAKEVLTTGVQVELDEVEVVTPRRTCYLAVHLAPRRGPQGELTGVIAVSADITDDVVRRKLEVGDGALVWTGDTSGLSNHANDCWRSYTGLATSAHWIEVVHPDDRARCAQSIGEAGRLRGSVEIEARLRRHDGVYRWHRVRFASMLGDRWLGAAVDVHDARNMEIERDELASRERAARADAEQANRLKDQFLAAVSHELRAPLTTLLLWEKVLRDDASDAALRRRALDAIHQSAMLQSRLVADLLDVSRAISGKLYIDLRPVDITFVLGEALQAFAPVAAEKQLVLDTHIEPPIGLVQADMVRIRQVLDNLLSNAIKFTDPGGRVDVSLRRLERSIEIEIADTGRGIAEELLPGLFQPFYQGDDALTRTHGGLGLGLAIAHQLVTLHHGTLSARSAGRGRGATFTVTLPASAARRSSTPPTGLRPQSLDGVRVLLVDDDPRVRDALALLLRRAGATVDTAGSADDARARFAAAPPMILLCDIAMPREDGYELIRKLRADGVTTPAIALTALARASDARDALDAGFDEHIAKPVDFERLVSCIAALLGPERIA